MGRIKVFLRSFCLSGRHDQAHNDPPFDRTIDVSHLAEPHITTGPSRITDRRSPSHQDSESIAEDIPTHHGNQQRPVPNGCAVPLAHEQSTQRNSVPSANQNEEPHSARPASSLQLDNSSSQPSSSSAPSPFNIYEPQNEPAQESHQNARPPINQSPPPVVPRYAPLASTSSTEPTTKLSYDIISVREPLAKILAERQQLLQRQQLQRQLLGEHDYIEVYGERGSSCFYEEIAGSVTSSATYDQIGTNSNHNYQVLINAYAVANRQPVPNQEGDNDIPPVIPLAGSNNQDNHGEHEYDFTVNNSDQVDGPSSSVLTSAPVKPVSPKTPSNTNPSPTQINEEEDSPNAKSIPVYSVINKATRRNNSIREPLDTSLPPKPPPKNILVSHHHNHQHQHVAETSDTSLPTKTWAPLHQVPSTSSFPDRPTSRNMSGFSAANSNNHRDYRLPQPPPRMSKNSAAFGHTSDRPLPSPNTSFDLLENNNNGKVLDRNNAEEDDIESLENGYELLKSNADEDQIDVGYEKIKESSRYSGGSISSQFYQRPIFDNGGYESVQPIYSSPSNALVEPNYEAIGPATASELAAAATAKLNAAASVIEQFLKKDQ